MRATFLVIALLFATAARGEAKLPGGADACVDCHNGNDAPAVDVDRVRRSRSTRDKASCTDCHAGYSMGPHDGELPALSAADAGGGRPAREGALAEGRARPRANAEKGETPEARSGSPPRAPTSPAPAATRWSTPTRWPGGRRRSTRSGCARTRRSPARPAPPATARSTRVKKLAAYAPDGGGAGEGPRRPPRDREALRGVPRQRGVREGRRREPRGGGHLPRLDPRPARPRRQRVRPGLHELPRRDEGAGRHARDRREGATRPRRCPPRPGRRPARAATRAPATTSRRSSRTSPSRRSAGTSSRTSSTSPSRG